MTKAIQLRNKIKSLKVKKTDEQNIFDVYSAGNKIGSVIKIANNWKVIGKHYVCATRQEAARSLLFA